jgi:hypothetical protein
METIQDTSRPFIYQCTQALRDETLLVEDLRALAVPMYSILEGNSDALLAAVPSIAAHFGGLCPLDVEGIVLNAFYAEGVEDPLDAAAVAIVNLSRARDLAASRPRGAQLVNWTTHRVIP